MRSAYCATVLSNPMALLHEQTPIALFLACQEAGVKRVVQVSALGVDKGIETAYFRTRRAPEAFLNALPVDIRWLILRPSVILMAKTVPAPKCSGCCRIAYPYLGRWR